MTIPVQKPVRTVGILTFQYAYNYGAILQLVSMQRVLSGMGVTSQAIDYRPPGSRNLRLWEGWGLRKTGICRNIKNRLLLIQYGPEARRKFDAFKHEHVDLSRSCVSLSEVADVADDYDAVVAGSDQIWKAGSSSVYFLHWKRAYDGRRISYAPSCGSSHQTQERYPLIQEWLREIDDLSVRDEPSRLLVEHVAGRRPEIVADPTLLADLWDLHKPRRTTPQRYILVYCLGNEIEGGHKAILSSIRSHCGKLPILAVVASAHKPQKFSWADDTIWDADPGEWLSLIANASFVYTDSFHCILFALKYRRAFLGYYAESERGPRLIDLSSRYGIERNIVNSVSGANDKRFWEGPDYARVESLVARHVEQSLSFLRRALGVETL